ncbi:MAG: gp58-like family protein [Oscillospiraceae bacterium]|nr:gp58-like family protein [Oscillospiraceae bacterium]
MSEKFFVGLDLTGFENNGAQRAVSRVTLVIDGEHVCTAGDDSGMELIADCPHATQEIAGFVLEQVKYGQYKMYSASDVNIDPAFELGDAITAAGLYSVIARIADDGSGFPSVSAPGQEELEDEFPSGGPLTQEFNRKFAQTRSLITKTASEIRLEVERVTGDVQELSASITIQLGKITSDVHDLDGNFSRIQQDIKGISATVSDVQTGLGQTLRLGADGVSIVNAKGSKLLIDGGQINAETLNLSGHISFSDLDKTAQDKISSASANAQNAITAANSAKDTVDGWSYNGTTYIDGAMIASDTIAASKLKGGSVEILDPSGNVTGVMKVEFPNFAARNVGITSGNIFLTAENGYISLVSDGKTNAGITLMGSNTAGVQPSVLVAGDVVPNSGTFNIGRSTASERWNNIFLNNNPTVTSDLRCKKNLRYDLEQYDPFFDALRPAAYTVRETQDVKVNLGLGAQDVEKALLDTGLSPDDFAGLVLPESKDGFYALRYEQLLPLCIRQIQQLKKRVSVLEKEVEHG